MEVVVGIVRLRNKFAMLQRSDGRWVFPGGKIEAGEDNNTALVREVAEETGLKVVPTHNLGSRPVGDNIVFYKVCRPLDGDLSLCEPEKFLSAQWMSVDEIMNATDGHLFAPVRDYLDDVAGNSPRASL